MSGLFRTGLFCNLPIGREFTIEPHTACMFRKIDNARAELISGQSFHLKRKGTKVRVGKNTDCFVKQSIN